MGLDISKISNALLKELAKTHDKDDNEKLEGNELTLFEADVEAIKESISKEDFEQVMGLYKTNPITTTEAEPVTDKMTPKQQKKWNKAEEKEFLRQLHDLAGAKVKREALAEILGERISNPELREAVADVYKLMPEYSSVRDINKKHDSVVKKMEAADIKDDLHMDILKELETMAENRQKGVAYAAINDLFMQAVEDDQKKGVKRTEEAVMKEIKEKLKDEKKFKKEYREMFKTYENDSIMREARRTISQAIYGELDETKWRKVRKGAKEALQDSKEWDKYTKKALTGQKFGDAISGKKSYGRIASENQARENNVRKHIKQSTSDIMSSMGNKMDVFVALKEAGLVKQLENGDWDLSELSEIIGTQVGADNRLNRHAKIDKAISEKLRLTGKLSVASKLSSLTEDEAKKLIKLCGYEIEGKDWGRALLGGLFGFAIGAGAGAGAAATNPQQKVIIGGDTIENNINLDLKGNFDAGQIPGLPKGSDVITTETGVLIKIHQLIQYPDKILELSKHVGATALKTGLVGAALGFLQGMEDKGEVPVSVTQFGETDIKDYVKRLYKETPEYADALSLLAQSFVENGKWDVEAYKNFLNVAAGDGGKLNRDELVGALKRIYAKKPVEETAEQGGVEEGDDGDGDQDCSAIVSSTTTDPTTKETDITYTHERQYGDTWKGIVEAYYPDLVKSCGGLYGKDGAIKRLQRELCTDKNGVFDSKKFKDLISRNNLPEKIKLPSVIDDAKRQTNKVEAATAEELQRGADTGERKPGLKEAGRNEIHTEQIAGTTTWTATDGCDTQQSAQGASKDEAVTALQNLTGRTYDKEHIMEIEAE